MHKGRIFGMENREGTGAGALTRRRFFEQLAAVGGMGLAVAGMEALGFGFASARAGAPAANIDR